jgi:hypothetical protein
MSSNAIPADVLARLKIDDSKRSAHFACLKAMPFCADDEPILEGVRRLGVWFRTACEIRHRWLERVVVLVLASIYAENTVTFIGKDLDQVWRDVTRMVVSPRAEPLCEHYLTNARAVAFCVLFDWFPAEYRDLAVSLRASQYAPPISQVIDFLQERERTDRMRQKVVSNLVSSAITNVLKSTRDAAKVGSASVSGCEGSSSDANPAVGVSVEAPGLPDEAAGMSEAPGVPDEAAGMSDVTAGM